MSGPANKFLVVMESPLISVDVVSILGGMDAMLISVLYTSSGDGSMRGQLKPGW